MAKRLNINQTNPTPVKVIIHPAAAIATAEKQLAVFGWSLYVWAFKLVPNAHFRFADQKKKELMDSLEKNRTGRKIRSKGKTQGR
jgi:hypothetical protein